MSNDLPTETLFLGKLENKLFAGDGTKLDGKFTALKMKILLVANKADLEGKWANPHWNPKSTPGNLKTMAWNPKSIKLFATGP